MTVRTRYAPSPTGVPHVGNLRTAIFDYLLARHHDGQFILRIEDTDQTRYSPEAIGGLLESLHWLGIDPDEGPETGGPYGPYVQSQRLALYQAAAAKLVAQGDAYECWCSSARLDALRAEQTRLKQPPRYDRRCRDDAGRAQSRAEAEAEGRNRVVRFKTPLEGKVTLDDPIHGELTFDLATIDDFVMLKSDGFPVYHLAYMVDDEAMKITHVLRDDSWIPSVPRHMLIYRALGIEPPVIAHVPRVLGPDGARLSKRHGATPVFEYRDQGYLPEALLNFLALIGWSLDDKTEILSRDQLIEHFTVDRIVKNPGIFNVEKLTWMNGVYIREMPEDRLIEVFTEWLERDLPAGAARPVDRALVARIAPLIRERIKLLSEVVEYCDFFFVDDLSYSPEDLLGKAYAGRAADAKAALEQVAATVGGADAWSREIVEERVDALESSLRALASELGVKAGDLFSPIRVAVTGRKISPPLPETMEILGREKCVARLRAAIAML